MTDAPPGNVVYGTLQGTTPLPTASLTGTVRAMVEAAAEAMPAGTLGAADVHTIVAEVIRAQPQRDPVARLALLVAVVALIVQWLSYRQDSAEYARTDPPPSVTVIVERPDPAEVERIVDERLREVERQRQADHGDGAPATARTGSRRLVAPGHTRLGNLHDARRVEIDRTRGSPPMPTTDPPAMIGRRLRELRVWRGLSLRATAELAGLSASYLSLIERGERMVERRSTLEALAAALRVAPSELGSVFPGSYADPDLAAARASLTAVEDALTDIELGDQPDRPTAAWPDIATRLAELARLRPLGDYASQGTLLPDLIADLHVALPEHRRPALEGLCQCYQAAAQMARSLGVRGMPHMAALRLRRAAEELDDPAWLGLAAYITAGASGRARSIVVADRGIAGMAAHLDDQRCREMTGQLHLVASLAETVLGHPDRGEGRIGEAADLARTVPDGELGFAGLMFGPTNTAAWKVSAAMERDPGTAAELADQVDVLVLPAPVRQAAYWADLGRGLATLRGRREDAVVALRRAEELSPQRVRSHPLAREAVVGLLRQARRDAEGRELRGLAYRMGVAG